MTRPGTRRAVVLSGAGPYSDPWHPFPQTSNALLELVRVARPTWDAHVLEDVEHVLARELGTIDLLVMNIGNAGPGTPSASARTALSHFVTNGGALFCTHSSATAFPDWKEWEQLLGGRWVRGTTFHPPKAPSQVDIATDNELTAGLQSFVVDDEMYSDLRVATQSNVLATHREKADVHPLFWTQDEAPCRAVYSALGHDLDAYHSEGLRALTVRALEWCSEVRLNS